MSSNDSLAAMEAVIQAQSAVSLEVGDYRALTDSQLLESSPG